MLYTLALQRIAFNYTTEGPKILIEGGSAEYIYHNKDCIKDIFPNISPTLCSLLKKEWDNELREAEREIIWCEQKGIKILSILSEEYPERLKTCPDAPLALFYKGNGDVNSKHIISIVGTRNATPYGQDMTRKIVSEICHEIPDIIVVSGLAYGIDIYAHRATLENGAKTIAVMAHGLDRIYPAIHRSTAREILSQGGLLTEFPQNTTPEKYNFIRRNRIVAGMTDCTLIVESKKSGGSLSTARLANDYNREVFALPGRCTDSSSEGCNALIASNKALLVTSAEDIINFMGWITEKERCKTQGVERSLFPVLSPNEELIVNVLKRGDMHQSMISTSTGIEAAKVIPTLFEMEMKGIIRLRAGGFYHLML